MRQLVAIEHGADVSTIHESLMLCVTTRLSACY